VRVGDLVRPKLEWATEHIDYGIGVVIDAYYDDISDNEYFKVSWKHECQWWRADELILVSKNNESR
jgi:hypothetical protein